VALRHRAPPRLTRSASHHSTLSRSGATPFSPSLLARGGTGTASFGAGITSTNSGMAAQLREKLLLQRGDAFDDDAPRMTAPPANTPLKASPRGTSRTHPLQSVSTSVVIEAATGAAASSAALAGGASRFGSEDTALLALSQALQNAALVRAEGRLAVDELMRGFEADFPPGSAFRAAGSALAARAGSIATRLGAGCSSLEAASARVLNDGARGVRDREAIIASLHDELHERDHVVASIARVASEQRHDVLSEAHVASEALGKEVERAEQQLEALVAEAEAQGVVFAEARRKQVEHLARVALHRLGKRDLARGWASWQGEHARKVQLQRVAASRFVHAAMHAALRRWVHAHPPQTAVRRAVWPYQQRIDELEAALRKERAAHAETRLAAEARLRDAGSASSLTSEAARRRHIEHLQGVALRRLFRLDLAKGWGKWRHEWQKRRANLQRAAARQRHPREP
jgi:hypothetical protein